MRRAKQHRRVLKGLVKDVRMTPSRAILTECLLEVFDATDAHTRRIYEIGTLSHAGGPKLVEIFLSQIEKEPDSPVKPTLRNYPNIKAGSHQSTHNSLQRDTRSHPNLRLPLAISAMMQDSETLHERLFFTTLYLGTCLDARGHVKVVGLDDQPVTEPLNSNSDKAVRAELYEGFDKFLTSIKGGVPTSGQSNEG